MRPKFRTALISGLLLIAAAGTAVITAAPSNGSGTADLLREGRALFFKDVRLALRMHPRAFSLSGGDLERILKVEGAMPEIYEAVLRLLWLEEIDSQPNPPDADSDAPSPEFRDAWLALCRKGAGRFVDSLFMRDPVPDRPASPCGALDLVLAGLGIGTAAAPSEEATKPPPLNGMGRAMRTIRLPDAFVNSLGAGVDIAVITHVEGNAAAGLLKTDGPPWKRGFPEGLDQLGADPTAASARAAAPEARLKRWNIIREPGSPFQYWSALQTALALREAVRAGARVVVVAHSFTADHPALRKACLRAYQDSVVITAPVGPDRGAGMEAPQSWPAHYRTVLAVAGVTYRSRERAAPIADVAASHHNDLAAFALGRGTGLDYGTAAGFCGGAAALVASLMPPRDDELPGQYFQGIREILVSSADAGKIGLGFFDPRVGYGLLDVHRALSERLDIYRAKREQVAAEMKRRLEQIEKAKQEAEAKRKENGK